MSETLDIIPILVVADSQNKAEMLNGLLRGEGLAVHPVWTAGVADWEAHAKTPDAVFYFADVTEPTLEEVVSAAQGIATPVIVIAGGAAKVQAAEALNAGAAAWVPADNAPLLAASLRRERRYRSMFARLKAAEEEMEHGRQRLRALVAGSQDALAYVHEGVIVEGNPAWTERFGYPQPDALTGLPIMDLFAAGSQGALKEALKSAAKRGARVDPCKLTALKAGGGEFEADVEIASVEIEGERQLQLLIHGAGEAHSEIGLQFEELEARNRELEEELHRLQQAEGGSRLLWPGTFSPVAAERVTRPLAGSVRAVVVLRPANHDEAAATFGPLGMAEAGAGIATTVSPLLEDDDIATRVDGLTLVALVNRPDEAGVQDWAQSLVKALGEHIFEANNRSSHIGFTAGYATVDRVRRLDALTRQALDAASGSAGSVNRSQAGASSAATETDDAGWAAMIQEALDERRFAIALRPIEDLSQGAKLYEATPRLLDREGKEIAPTAFLAAAERLDLINPIQRRLLGHVFIAVLRLLKAGDEARLITPLSAAAMADKALSNLLLSLVQRTRARLPAKSLILELSLEEAGSRLREAEEFAAAAAKLNCGLGLREYVPGETANKLLEHLSLDTLRLSPAVVARLASDEATAERVRTLAKTLGEKKCRVIASGVADANMMALLYNLGIGTIEGPAIGEPELFSPIATETSVLKEFDAA